MNPPQRFKSLRRIVLNVSTLFGAAYFEKTHEVTVAEDNDNGNNSALGEAAPQLLPQPQKPSKLLGLLCKMMGD